MRLQRVDPGFEAQGVMTMRIARSEARDSTPALRLVFWNEVLERVGALPGVLEAGLNSDRPPRGAGNINNFDLLDKPVGIGEDEPMAVWLIASPGYFDALKIRLVDPTTLALVALAMLGTALVAVWLPASRAARLEPAQVLRLE